MGRQHLNSLRVAGQAMHSVGGCELVVCVEDRFHEQFARRVLIKLGYNIRQCRIKVAPRGKGAAEQWVRSNYASEVRLHRKRSKAIRPNSGVLALIDADTLTVEQRKAQLDSELRALGENPRRPNEPIALWIPRRHIETWLVYLCGGAVTEDDDVKRGRFEASVSQAADSFLELFHERKRGPLDTLPSIDASLEETLRIRS